MVYENFKECHVISECPTQKGWKNFKKYSRLKTMNIRLWKAQTSCLHGARKVLIDHNREKKNLQHSWQDGKYVIQTIEGWFLGMWRRVNKYKGRWPRGVLVPLRGFKFNLWDGPLRVLQLVLCLIGKGVKMQVNPKVATFFSHEHESFCSMTYVISKCIKFDRVGQVKSHTPRKV